MILNISIEKDETGTAIVDYKIDGVLFCRKGFDLLPPEFKEDEFVRKDFLEELLKTLKKKEIFINKII